MGTDNKLTSDLNGIIIKHTTRIEDSAVHMAVRTIPESGFKRDSASKSADRFLRQTKILND